MLCRLLLGLLWCASATLIQAQPPDVTALFPAGGQRETDVVVKLQGNPGTAPLRLWIDRPGIQLQRVDEKDVLRLAADAPRGTAWLRFHNDQGAAFLRPFVIGDATELHESEPNDSLAKAQHVMHFPATFNGLLEKAGEVDTVRVSLKRGETLVAVLAAKQTLGSPMDGLLQVVDPQGFVLEQNDDQRGFDPRLILTAPKDGDYFVRVFAFPAAPDTAIRFSGAPSYIYRLTLTTGPFLDRVAPCAVMADQPTKVIPGGWNLPADLGEMGIGPFPAGIRAIAPDGWESTAKVLAVPHPVVMEQEPNPLAQPQDIAIPGTCSGVIGELKDADAWKFTAKSGQRVSLRLTALTLGSALDAVVRIFDSSGQRISEVDDAPQEQTDIVVEFTAPKDGDFVVTVTDRFAHGGAGYWYALSLAEPQPAAVLQVATDGFVVKAETPLEIPVTIDRRLGYALPLKVNVEGLPEGVTADPVVSDPQGDSSKLVKLMVKSTRTESWTGPIRIIGRADGDTLTERVAQFKSTLTDDWLPHLWLTSSPK